MRVFLLIILACLTFPVQATNTVETVTLTPTVRIVWDANVETNLAGYFVYTSIGSNTWTYQTTNTQAFIQADLLTTNVVQTNAYTFYVTAFNTDGIESDPSDSLILTFVEPVDPELKPKPPSGFRLTP